MSPSPKLYAVIWHPDKAVMRVELPGFVEEIACDNGQFVEEGQVLLRLENRVKELELEKLQLEVRRSDLKARQLLENDMVSSFQAEQENLESLRKRLAVLEKEMESLVFRAPVAGRVAADRFESLPGSHLGPGQVVLTIIPESDPELMLCIHQDDIEAVARRRATEVKYKLRGRPGTEKASLTRNEARASTSVPHPALTALGGGPLLVRQKPEFNNEREQGLAVDRLALERDRLALRELGRDEEDAQLANQELVTPHLIAYADLGEADGTLKEGEWGTAKFTGGQKYRLGTWCYEQASGWARRQFEKAREVN